MTSRYSLALPVRDGGQVALPLVTLVVHEHIVELAGIAPRTTSSGLERIQRRAEVIGHALELRALGE
jgi:hypothetical protein